MRARNVLEQATFCCVEVCARERVLAFAQFEIDLVEWTKTRNIQYCFEFCRKRKPQNAWLEKKKLSSATK